MRPPGATDERLPPKDMLRASLELAATLARPCFGAANDWRPGAREARWLALLPTGAKDCLMIFERLPDSFCRCRCHTKLRPAEFFSKRRVAVKLVCQATWQGPNRMKATQLHTSSFDTTVLYCEKKMDHK